MADLAVWQRTIVDEEGNVVPGAEVEVRREEDGSLATLYADRAGETPLSNPLAADMSGFVRFFAQGDAYTITAVGAGSTRTWRFDPTGRLQEFDRVSDALVADDAADLLSARANLGTFSSVADVQNSHIPPVLDSITVSGTRYEREGSEPSHNSKVQSADGSWWVPVVPFGYAFDSVSDMQASRLVTPGARVRTLGYYTPGDGGGNDYEIVAAGTGTDDGGSFIDLSGSGLQAKGLQGIEVNVLHYGAGKPDGSDCSSNIQSAVNRLKSIHQQEYTAKIVFPPFTYNIESSIDMTGIRHLFKEWYVDARGAVFNIKTTGAVGFDLFGSRKCIWTGGILHGDEVNTPSIGIQIGRDASGTSSDVHVFNELSLARKFTFCCIYNNAAEGVGFINVVLGNNNNSLQSYCLVQDGSTYWDVPSQFVATQTQGTSNSFNENYFINLDARKTVTGSPVWMSRTSRHKYYSSYVVTYDDAGFVVDAAQPTRGLHLDAHVETAQGDPKHYIRFESDSVVSEARCPDLLIQEHSLHAKSLLGKENVDTVVLENANISVIDIHANVVSPSLIDGATSDWTIYGSLHLCSGLYPNSRFVGCVFDHNPASDISFPGTNEVVHTNMDDGITQHIGGIKIAKRSNDRGVLAFSDPATGATLGNLQYYDNNNGSFLFSTSQSGELLYVIGSGVYPGAGKDGLMSLGTGARRWSEVYAVTGAINTSDAREKTPIRPLSEAERNVAVRLSRLPGVYQWLSAIAQKGEDEARLHVGVTAQDVKAAFEAEGLDGFRYGVLCYDEWEPEVAVTDDDGSLLSPAVEAGDRYGVRYDELAQWQAAGWNVRLEALEISSD